MAPPGGVERIHVRAGDGAGGCDGGSEAAAQAVMTMVTYRAVEHGRRCSGIEIAAGTDGRSGTIAASESPTTELEHFPNTPLTLSLHPTFPVSHEGDAGKLRQCSKVLRITTHGDKVRTCGAT